MDQVIYWTGWSIGLLVVGWIIVSWRNNRINPTYAIYDDKTKEQGYREEF